MQTRIQTQIREVKDSKSYSNYSIRCCNSNEAKQTAIQSGLFVQFITRSGDLSLAFFVVCVTNNLPHIWIAFHLHNGAEQFALEFTYFGLRKDVNESIRYTLLAPLTGIFIFGLERVDMPEMFVPGWPLIQWWWPKSLAVDAITVLAPCWPHFCILRPLSCVPCIH